MGSKPKNREVGECSLLPAPVLLSADRVKDRRLSSAAGLDPFFAALERRDDNQPVRILQIGDSHTANDAFSGRMRRALQARFGAAGRGWLPGGIPFRYYRPQLVTVSQAGWRQLGVVDDAHAEAIGIDATVAQSERCDARMRLVSREGFNRLAIEFLAQPNGGALSIRVDQQHPVRISTAALIDRATRRTIPIGGRAHVVELQTVDEGPVHLIGWTTEQHRAGIIYENHGTIGATVNLLGRMHPATVAHELSDSRPALLVIAFGTNEGFDAQLDLRTYRASFLEQVAALQRVTPQAAILVLGPPDGNRIGDPSPPEAGNADGSTGLYSPAGSSAWRAPPNLAGVRCIQQTVAAEMGWAFWDWSQAMGGPGSMHRLVMRDPPLALPDHVHLNKSGYEATAEVLFFDLINKYEEWRSRRSGS
jgi:lysophospholipase L1-like esterase